jgi:hypothetical protein
MTKTQKAANAEVTKLIKMGQDIIKQLDIMNGAMDEEFNPHNQLLSKEENKECWEYASMMYVRNVINLALGQGSFDLIKTIFNDSRFYEGFNNFLGRLEQSVRYGNKQNKGIENIINHSGITRKTWVLFLD